MDKKSLITKIARISGEIKSLNTKKEWLNSYESVVSKRKEDLSKTLNILQKGLGLHCIGGNRKASIKYTAAENMLDSLPYNQESLSDAIVVKNKTIDNEILRYLVSTDRGFGKFMKMYEEVIIVHDYLSQLDEEVDEAIDAVDSAQSTETIDLLSNNSFVSLMSSASNSSAQSEIDDVQELLPQLNEHIKKIKSIAREFKNSDININITDVESLDLVLDLCLDGGFDFSSIMSLSALSSAEDDLEEIQEPVQEFLKKVVTIKKEMEKERDSAISKVKQEIGIGKAN